MQIIINDVIHRKDSDPECPILGTPLSLTVTMGRWGSEARVPGVEMKTVMADFTVDVNIRQLSRDQLGNLARDIVYAMVADPRWQEEFEVYVRPVSHFNVDFYPRLFGRGTEEYAMWNWGNKWSSMGSMGPTRHKGLRSQSLDAQDLYNPEQYTLEELSSALRCTAGLLTGYIRGKLRGHMEWSELDTVHENVQETLPRMVRATVLSSAATFHPTDEWQAAVAKGETELGYLDWLRYQLDRKEETE